MKTYTDEIKANQSAIEEKLQQEITEKELEIVFTNLCLTDMDLRILDLESRATNE